jgi:hypothetical protein
MDIIEIEECLGELRKQIQGESEELTNARILICNAQNIIQKWIEKNKQRSEWKHTRTA